MVTLIQQTTLPTGVAAANAPSPSIYLCPIGLRLATTEGGTRMIAGGSLKFTEAEVIVRWTDRAVASIAPVDMHVEWATGEGSKVQARTEMLLCRLAHSRSPFAGLVLDRPHIMGVINVTPDSFSDGGKFISPSAAIAQGRKLRAAGAAILDIGGESTRPGATPVSIEEEIDRVVPVIAGLKECGAAISIDTRRAAVMAAALDAGASIVNDVSALTHDPDSLALVARGQVPVVLMHTQGEPATMQVDPRYDCAPLDVFDYLEARVAACVAAGISPTNIAVDPGIGFGKTVAHNLEILGRLALFHGLGVPILLGVSRKGFIGRLSRAESADQRLAGSLAAALAGVAQGVQILRVHDVAETAQALAVWQAIQANS